MQTCSSATDSSFFSGLTFPLLTEQWGLSTPLLLLKLSKFLRCGHEQSFTLTLRLLPGPRNCSTSFDVWRYLGFLVAMASSRESGRSIPALGRWVDLKPLESTLVPLSIANHHRLSSELTN